MKYIRKPDEYYEDETPNKEILPDILIEVRGGVAYVTVNNPNITYKKIDYDNEEIGEDSVEQNY